MKEPQRIQVLLLENQRVRPALWPEIFDAEGGTEFRYTRVERLDEGLARLATDAFDLILVDLTLPDSQGLATFEALQRQAPGTPILVLNPASRDPHATTGESPAATAAEGASSASKIAWRNPGRYAVARSRAEREDDDARWCADSERELRALLQRAALLTTAVTARIYSVGSLREGAPREFEQAVETYIQVLSQSLDERAFDVEHRSTSTLRSLGDRLGYLRARPRDVVEIHTTGLQRRLQNEPSARARALMEESRLLVLELMGHLASYYRSYYTFGSPPQKDPPS